MNHKVVIIGPESTGKSTLTKDLAHYFECAFVDEYAREYLLGKPGNYAQKDVEAIAAGQIRLEDQITAINKLTIIDTDLFVIKVWMEHKFGNCPNWILQEIAKRKPSCYILTNIDLPWQDDPLREHPDPFWRQYFYNCYLDIVQSSNVPFFIASGDKEKRLKDSVQFLNELFMT